MQIHCASGPQPQFGFGKKNASPEGVNGLSQNNLKSTGGFVEITNFMDDTVVRQQVNLNAKQATRMLRQSMDAIASQQAMMKHQLSHPGLVEPLSHDVFHRPGLPHHIMHR